MTPGPTRRSSTRSRPTPRSSRCRSAATTSGSRDPRELRHREPVRRARAGPIRRRAATTSSPTRIAATAPKVAAVLQGIHARSPSARVFVVNYAAILPETGVGCWPQVPLAFADVPYLRGKRGNAQRDARPAGRRPTARPRRRLHGEHRPATPASRRRRAGSSRWSRPTPRRRSTPTPAARRASRRSWSAAVSS